MRTAILLFFALLMSGCANVDDSKKTITLDSALRQYERAIRWGEFQAANLLRKPPNGTAANMAGLKSVRVTAYDTLGKTESADRTRAQVDVEIRYYNEYAMKEITIIDQQLWEYDPEGKSWYITSPMPAFK